MLHLLILYQDIPDIITIRKQGSSQSHRDFHVRRSVVLAALQFLISNNIYFHNISINSNHLALLREDGNIFDQHINRIESEVLDLPDQSEGNVSEDQCTDHLSRPFVPRSYQTITEEENIRQSLQHDRSVPSTIMWPTRGQNPINEFNT